jgi:4-aminobutyrate aminotransferase-like enzyme
MAPLDVKPNELEPYWIPFTPNRAFKKRPRIFSGAKGLHYFKPDGTKVIDATSGLFCVNAGHCREPIVKAIQEMAAKLDYAPAFQYGHPKVFELAPGSRCSLPARSTTPSSPTRARRPSTPRSRSRSPITRPRARAHASGSSAASAAITASASAASRSAAWSPTASSSATC